MCRHSCRLVCRPLTLSGTEHPLYKSRCLRAPADRAWSSDRARRSRQRWVVNLPVSITGLTAATVTSTGLLSRHQLTVTDFHRGIRHRRIFWHRIQTDIHRRVARETPAVYRSDSHTGRPCWTPAKTRCTGRTPASTGREERHRRHRAKICIGSSVATTDDGDGRDPWRIRLAPYKFYRKGRQVGKRTPAVNWRVSVQLYGAPTPLFYIYEFEWLLHHTALSTWTPGSIQNTGTRTGLWAWRWGGEPRGQHRPRSTVRMKETAGWDGVNGQMKKSGPWADIRWTFIGSCPPGLSRAGKAWHLHREHTGTTPRSVWRTRTRRGTGAGRTKQL